MNIVKGVADLIRRTSSGQIGEYFSGSQAQRLSPPRVKIRFSEIGDEAILKTLWDRYEKADKEEEKRRLFFVFLKQFLVVYKNWEPDNSSQWSEPAETSIQTAESSSHSDVVTGCYAGHPAAIILTLTEEVTQVTALVTKLNTSMQSKPDLSGSRTSPDIKTDGIPVLEALAVVTRSLHNCRVFWYHGGIQKLMVLMKGAVIQLKTISGALSTDDNLSDSSKDKMSLMQQLLLHVVSIICSFIDIHSNIRENALSSNNTISSVSKDSVSQIDFASSSGIPSCDARSHWHQKAVVSIMEAGGLNWLVELLRVIRRLSLKEQQMDMSLHCLTLRILHSSLFENPRGQNHFRSIGGLEVLLDGLGVPSYNGQILKDSSFAVEKGDENPLLKVLQLHTLSLEVLREAVFANVNNLQFLCENGRVQKFANSFCSPAFVLQECIQKLKEFSCKHDFQMQIFGSCNASHVKSHISEPPVSLSSNIYHSPIWSDYVVKVSRVLCSFLLIPEDIQTKSIQLSSGRIAMPVSSVYGELSIKWVMRALLTVFPCLKACSNQNELPNHLRVFINSLQHCVLDAFRKVLASSPLSIEIFRAEGIWDLIFSENFFYFGPSCEELTAECFMYRDSPRKLDINSPNLISSQTKACGVEILQMEVISFVEFTATSNGSSHNLPEISVLVDALEQSACNPELSTVIGKSILRILQLSVEKTIASFKTLNAVSRVLKVACIQAQESKRLRNISPSNRSDLIEMPSSHIHWKEDLPETTQSWLKCIETSVELFTEFITVADDGKSLVLNSSTCIDCLFDLFWEEGLRSHVLKHVIDLMKIAPSSSEHQTSKLHLCSKYVETFTQIKDREKSSTELSIDLLVGMRDMIMTDPTYYQALFRDGECFLHVVSLLNGSLDDANGEKLVLNVLQTLTCLLSSNDASKAAFSALAGKGYQAMQSLLLDFCQWHSSEAILNALLDMLFDGKFDVKANPAIKNEDVIILYLSVLQKSSESLKQQGLDAFQQLLRESISNRASCVRAGMLNFLLDWFALEDNDGVILKIAQLIQVIGGHSISGKDIRKIFALLRSEKVGNQQKYCSLLLSTVLSMLNEKGPTAFFDFSGTDSGIMIKTPVQCPLNKGYSFSCWLRVENFPRNGTMGLFSFLTENGRGCFAVLDKDKLIYESINLKRQCVQLPINLARKKWHFLCMTHSIGRAFSGGSLLRCYVDGALVSSERCRYAKVNESFTSCKVGSKINMSQYEEDIPLDSIKDSSPFNGQIGPVYLFNDAISPEQIQGIYSLGPSYMYSFLDNEVASSNNNLVPSGILDVKEGLASKIIFGLNAQASDGRKLYNVSPMLDGVIDRNSFEATVMVGTQLCSRRLLQQIIYCVGGVSVFFPLIAWSDRYENEENVIFEHTMLMPVARERVTAEVVELIASVLDENLANQQQMHLLSGFSILGFLLQSVPPEQLNLETLSALKHLFNVVANCGLAELLAKDAISSIFLNPLIWLYTSYKVQRELYMFLIQHFDNDPRLLASLCCLPYVLDIIRKFYCDNSKSRFALADKPFLNPSTEPIIVDKPSNEELRKIRLLLLSLGEMALRQNIAAVDIKALIAFFETSRDMSCIEDVLHMVIRAVSQKPLVAAFLDQVNSIGGCQIFVNLLQREFEPIRLLSLQFLGRLLVGLPVEMKGPRFFNLAVGRSRTLSENHKKISSKMQPIFSAMADRLFRFPQTDNLCASLFDVLLGGASPRQVLQKHNQVTRPRSKGRNSHFFLPQILVLIFRFLSGSEDAAENVKIIQDLLDLLDSNPLNIEAFMEFGWNAWLTASIRLDVFKDCKMGSQDEDKIGMNEQNFVRNLFSVVLCHYLHSVKGGWQQLEETVNFFLMHSEQGNISCCVLHYIYEDLVQKLMDLSSEENIFSSQPCRDNTLYLLKLVDELLISEMDHKLPFPASSSDFSLESSEIECQKDYDSVSYEVLRGQSDNPSGSTPWSCKYHSINEIIIHDEKWWKLYDNLWIIISEMNGKGPSKVSLKSSSSVPTLGQRARGLVESLNIPAAEVAAAVVSGGIGNALVGKPNKNVDKAMLLRGERCPRIIFRLVILHLCRSSLERASRCVQQVIPLLPCLLTADDEQSKSRLQLFIWALLAVRSQYGMLDDATRFHVISHMIRETVNCGKSMLATSMAGIDDCLESGGNSKETGSIHNIIQNDRVLAAVADEVKYIKTLKIDRTKQLQDLSTRVDENSSAELANRKVFEDEIQSSLNSILASDDSRRAAFQLTYEEEKQTVAEKWIHMFRSLIDERGPWSANPFPNSSSRHWKLDKTEDAWRRRPKLRQNYHFDEKLCHPSSSVSCNEAVPTTSESKPGYGGHIPEQMKRFLLKGVQRITDEFSLEPNENDDEQCGPKSILKDPSENQCPELVNDTNNWVQERKDSFPLLEAETSEVLTSVPCVLVTPRRKLAGQLAVMKNVLHFFGEFLVEGSGGSSVFKNFHASSISYSTKPEQKYKPLRWPTYHLDSDKGTFVDNSEATNEDMLKRKELKSIKRHRRWNIEKIKAVHWTRYLLRYTAIEVFFSDSVAPIFLNFASQNEAKDIGTLIVATRNEYLFPKGSGRDKSGIISFVDRHVALEMAETARESWRRRDITNFEYLMILNTLAGRSYNDLTQYPVFPWVLDDYSSEVLDFNKSSTFRDLSKPVGALDSKRLEVFEDRYRNFCDPDIPSFYYGSHYSSMGIVLYYLVRLEPFTTLHRNLQGGKFDHADRLFQSIEATYQNCLSNTSDVKELIPEFFYLPEILVNSNSYHLGVKQDGEPIGDICLPPWAKGSPEEFICRNREALESEYVSSNLHHWIDLIFGYKQRGKPAVEAANIFYYLTYEGAVDLDTMEDDLQRSAIEDQIANFGQTPIQIFRKKHPRRGPPIPIAHPLFFAPSSINLTSIASSSSSPSSAVLYVHVLDSNIVLVNQGITLSVKMWLTTQLQSGGNFTFSGSQDPFFGVGSDTLSPRKIGSPLSENVGLGVQCFTTLQTPSENFLISCGNWENSFQVISLIDGRMVQSIRQHKDVVSCVAVTSDGSILATGSIDTTVMVWEVVRGRILDKRIRNTQTEQPRKDSVIVETPFHILCGHDDIITCLFVSVELDIVISGSKDGTCIFHTLREGRYVRSLRHPSGCALSKLVASQHGRIVFYTDEDLSLNLHSINGKHLASSESSGRLNCLELSRCGGFLVCAGDQGQIILRSMNSLEVIRKYSGVGKVITSLTVTSEECFLAGTKEGVLLVYSIGNPQLRKASIPRTSKAKPS